MEARLTLLEMPAVSVVIPARDSAEWIDETIASVAVQSYPRALIEAVVVDDGSTDGTLGRASESLTRNGIVHRTFRTPGWGPSAARNAGWRLSRFPWIQFLDSDDLLAPEKIALQVEAARKSADDVAVIYSPWQRLGLTADGWHPTGRVVRPVIAGDPILDLLSAENFLAVGSFLVRRSWLERVGGFDECRRVIEDVQLLLRISVAGGGFVGIATKDPLMFYRQRGEQSLSGSDIEAFADGCVANAQLAEGYWRSSDRLSSQQAKFLASVHYGAAGAYARTNYSKWASSLNTCLRLDPGLAVLSSRMRLMVRMLGFRRAETIARAYRRLRYRTVS